MRRTLALVLAALVAVGCASPDPDRAATTTSTPSEPAAATDRAASEPTEGAGRLRALVGPGDPTAAEALAVFATAFGPMPGVEALDADLASGEGVGDLVLHWVARHHDELTDDQRAAVLAALVPADGTAHGRSVRPRRQDVDVWERWAEEDRTDLEARLGRSLGLTIRIRLLGTHRHVTGAYAVTDAIYPLFGERPDGGYELGPNTCLIQIGTDLVARSESSKRSALAHEVFHCFQEDAYHQGGAALADVPDWFHEGAAAWVGEKLVSGSHNADRWWARYLGGTDGRWELAGADYDAIGLYGHLSAGGVNVWEAIAQTLDGALTDGDAILERFVGNAAAAATLPRIGASSANRHAWGSAWTPAGEGVDTASGNRAPTPAVPGPTALLAPPTGNAIWVVEPPSGAAVLRLSGSGFGALRWGDLDQRIEGDASGRWCLLEECVCPDGRPMRGGPYEAAPREGELWVGLSSLGTATSSLTAQTQTAAELCDEEPVDGLPAGSGPRAMLTGPEGGLYDDSLGVAYCTADTTGGSWILQIGRQPGRNISVVVDPPPSAPGPQPVVSVLWGTATRPLAGAPGTVVTFDDDLRSGTFSGTVLDPAAGPPTGRFSGSFDCGDGGRPLSPRDAPWHGR